MKNFILKYLQYNAWANQKICQWLKTIPDEMLLQKVESSFPSIDATAQHMIRTECFWLEFVLQKNYTSFDWSYRQANTEATLKNLPGTSTNWAKAISSLSEEALSEILELNMPWAKNKVARHEYIVHVVNHSTFHRGQLITIARQIGIRENIPNTDYNIFNTPV